MKVVLLTLLLFICFNAETTEVCERSGKELINNADLKSLPVIELKKQKLIKLKEPFCEAVGGAVVKERTYINMRYDEKYLEIQFECLDDQWVNENFYTEDNTSIFRQEVLEIFICNGSEAQEQYFEIEINPNNAIFLSRITNRYKSDRTYKAEFISTKTSGVLHSAVKDAKNGKWTGFLKLPLQMLYFPLRISEDTFRLNIFRIILKEKPSDSNWVCNAENAIFACWNSTLEAKPQFHKPESFGYLILK